MNRYLKITTALAAFALLLVVMGLSAQGTVNAQTATQWVQSCDPYPDRTSATELGTASPTCPAAGDGTGDNEYNITPDSETLTVYNPRFARSAAGNNVGFTSATTLIFVPRTANLRTGEVPAFSGDRIQITSDSASLGATFNVVLVDNASPSLVVTAPSTPLVVKGGVSVTFSAEFTDTGAGFVGRTTPTADTDGIEDLTLGQDESGNRTEGGNLTSGSSVREGGLRLVVAGQVITLPASAFTKIDNGWRVTREIPSSNIQNIGANVPWYFEVADRANNKARTSDSIKGKVNTGGGTSGNEITINRFKGALNGQTFDGTQIRVTATREIDGEDVTVTSRPRNVTTFAATADVATGTGTFALAAVDTGSSSIFPDADEDEDDYQCPLDDGDATTDGDCDLDDGDEYEIVGSSLITVDDERPMLGQVTTGKGWNSTTSMEAPNRANSIKVTFSDDGKDANDNTGSGIDAATVAASAFTVADNTVTSVTSRPNNTVYLTLGSALGSTDTPTVLIADGVIRDKAGNSVQGSRATAADGLGPNLTVTTSADVSKSSVTVSIESDELLLTAPDVWVVEAAANGAAPVDISADSEDGVRQAGAMAYTYTRSDLGTDPQGGVFNVYVSAEDVLGNGRTAGDKATVASTSAVSFELDKTLNGGEQPEVRVTDTPVAGRNRGGDTENDVTAVPAIEAIAPMIVTVDFEGEGDEYDRDNAFETVELTSASYKVTFRDGSSETTDLNVTTDVNTPDNKVFTISLLNPRVGSYELTVKAMDTAGNNTLTSPTATAAESLKFNWRVVTPSPVEIPLTPGWNLISLPFQAANPAINSLIPASHPTDIVMTFDNASQTWMISRRDAETGLFVGDIPVMTANTAYFVRTTNYQPLEMLRPPLATAAAAPPPPPAITVVEGWNLVPVVTNTPKQSAIAADVYFGTLGSGSDAGWLKALTFDTLARLWISVTPGDTLTLSEGGINPCTGKAVVPADVQTRTEPCQIGTYQENSSRNDDVAASLGDNGVVGGTGADADTEASGGRDGYVGTFDVDDTVTIGKPVTVGKGYWLYATADGVIIPS